MNTYGVKAPWVFAIVLMATIVACFILLFTDVPASGFQFSAILIGGFVSKALIAVQIGALRTVLLMVGSALLLIVVNLVGVDGSVFKDKAVEGLLSMAGGGIVVVIGALLERHQKEN